MTDREGKKRLLPSSRDRYILTLVVAYAAAALAWIFFSDKLLTIAFDLSSIRWVSTFKGSLFVLVTSMFFFFAMRSVPPSGDSPETAFPYRPFLDGIGERPLSRRFGYVLGISMTLLMLLLRLQLNSAFDGRQVFIVFVIPITLSSLLGGLGPGLAATAAAAAISGFFLFGNSALSETEENLLFFQWGMLIFSGLAVCLVGEAMYRSRRRELKRLAELRAANEKAEAALAALRESDERYRLISERAADVIWVLDIGSGRFTYVSPSVERLRGFTPGEVMAQSAAESLTPESARQVPD